MWNIDPALMCDHHLLAEHLEMHMFAGALRRGKSLRGYLDGGLVEVHNIRRRHDALASEMARRGMRHRTPLEWNAPEPGGRVDRQRSRRELLERCARCRARAEEAGRGR
ncbi:MAG: pyrimidine dimer DNA glycosylase/endonuclease V [Pseudomonadota bacterium]